MSQLEPQVLSVRGVFETDRYLIPIYQRAYAWTPAEIETLLSDVRDYRVRAATEGGPHKYYIGSLVTYARRDPLEEGAVFEVVDGQQRLTTLFIVLALLSDPTLLSDIPLRFEGRDRSTSDLTLLARRGQLVAEEDLRDSGIATAVQCIRTAWTANEFEQADVDYLLDNVLIVRTTLPASTDLNHYFEVMNSRGEQLEKHEIVKAALMEKLSSDDDHARVARVFAQVWDACSDMNRHVVANFSSTRRRQLFGMMWDHLVPRSFDEIVDLLDPDDASTSSNTKLGWILDDRSGPSGTQPTVSDGDGTDETDGTDRAIPIIDFPNFLLHVLALTQGTAAGAVSSWTAPPIPLDDKRLVDLFENSSLDSDGVKRFAHTLLRTRYLFDRYVIKSDRSRDSADDSNWVLHRVRKIESGKGKLSPISTFAPVGAEGDEASTQGHAHVVLLQSMFQVTDPRRSYKNFLFSILRFLDEREDETALSAEDFIAFLQDLATNRFASVGTSRLDLGTSAPHFVFNYLDYLLWSSLTDGPLSVDDRFRRITPRRFRYGYRNSVEHFYPQNPDPASTISPLPHDEVNRFGNLCLMSRSDNSKRSNLAPSAKVQQYKSDEQSLKFQLMAAITVSDGWDAPQIDSHGADMRMVLQGALTPPDQ